MHNQPYVGRIALGTRKKLLKSGEIRHFYGINQLYLWNSTMMVGMGCFNSVVIELVSTVMIIISFVEFIVCFIVLPYKNNSVLFDLMTDKC